jgi:hypothetical protein
MIGCFDNSPEDRAREKELDDYLATQKPEEDQDDEEDEEDETDEGDDEAEAFAREKDERNTDRRCDL